MKGKQPYHSPFGYRPSKEEKDIGEMRDAIDALELIITKLVTTLYEQEQRIEGGIYLSRHPFGEVMELVRKLNKKE